jgi:hypothetical protein
LSGFHEAEKRLGMPILVIAGRLSLKMKRKMSRMARKEREAQDMRSIFT